MAARHVGLLASINGDPDIASLFLFMLIGIPQLNNQVPAAAVDDVFAFAPVKMQGRHLTLTHVHDLLGIAFVPGFAAGRAVAQGKEG